MTASKDNIIALPNKHLRKSSRRIGAISGGTRKLINDMKIATLDWEDSREHEVGVALAAVQVDKLLRLVVIRENFDDKTNRNFLVFINPEITKYEGKIVEDFEGCLSVANVYGKVPRYEKVKVKAIDESGKSIRLKAEGFMARVFQHEIDHTNGKLFIDHIKKKPKNFFRLKEDGQLEPLDYEKDIEKSTILW